MPQPQPTPTTVVVTPAAPRPAAPFTGDPGDADVLAGLRARREMLSQQLERVSERRGELANQITSTSHAEGAVRHGLEQRLQVLDEQVVQLERDMVTTDRQIASAPPLLLAQTEQPVVVHERHGPDEDDLIGMGFAGFGLGLVVMLIGGRIRRWRRRGERGAAGDARDSGRAAGPDPRIDRLAHAVDAIAVEVERIGEGQRFVTQLLADSRARVPEYSVAGEGPPTQSLPGARS